MVCFPYKKSVLTILFLCGLLLFWPRSLSYSTVKTHRVDWSAGNATLGFEVILVVSPEVDKDNSWRREGLIEAADSTDINVQIPPQPDYVEEEVRGMYDGEARGLSEAQIEKIGKAWISHLNVLRHVVDRNYTTALILEDDADWDVALRSQTPLIAAATQELFNSSLPTLPWSSSWDIFWLGNGGAGSPKNRDVYMSINDPTTIHLEEFRTKRPFYPSLQANTRLVFQTHNPICTFGYAVTQRGARKILEQAAGPGWAFDVRVSDGCVSGDLMCMTVAPEIFHHMRWPSHAGASDKSEISNMVTEPFTMNIMHSARCNAGRKWEYLLPCRPDAQMRAQFDN